MDNKRVFISDMPWAQSFSAAYQEAFDETFAKYIEKIAPICKIGREMGTPKLSLYDDFHNREKMIKCYCKADKYAQLPEIDGIEYYVRRFPSDYGRIDSMGINDVSIRYDFRWNNFFNRLHPEFDFGPDSMLEFEIIRPFFNAEVYHKNPYFATIANRASDYLCELTNDPGVRLDFINEYFESEECVITYKPID